MPLTPVEFAAKIQLHPFACARIGRLNHREKTFKENPDDKTAVGVPFSALLPHYATAGVAPVQWTGDVAIREAQGAQIEIHFALSPSSYPGEPGAIAYTTVRRGDLLQLTFGRQGVPPTAAAYRVLREAGATLDRIMRQSQEIFLVAYPSFSPGKFGAVNGRLHLLGLFSLEGEPLYVNPEALRDGLFKADFPVSQKERSLIDDTLAAAPQAAAASESWYDRLSSVLSAFFKGKDLHQAILKARANELVEKGVAPNLETAIALAAADAPSGPGKAPSNPTAKAPEALAPSTRQASGKKLLGRG